MGERLLFNILSRSWKNALTLCLSSGCKAFRGDDKAGDIAFSTGDLLLSFGSVSSLTLKPDAWKLFRYIQEDYTRNWRTLGAVGGANELIGDAVSGFNIYQLVGEEHTNWAALEE
ncbi:DUF4225 domain-containing protein [Pseudocitrobacter faecalis]|nr:DUF4225 domain-containing protein [Pseudocitrobacter faecalis]